MADCSQIHRISLEKSISVKSLLTVSSVSLNVSIGMSVNCHHWQTIHKQDGCIQCRQEAVNISVRFVLHSWQIGFAASSVQYSRSYQVGCWQVGDNVCYINAPDFPLPDITWTQDDCLVHFIVRALLLSASAMFLQQISVLPHQHLCCLCQFPVSKPDSAVHIGKDLITSAERISRTDCKDHQPRVIIKKFWHLPLS